MACRAKTIDGADVEDLDKRCSYTFPEGDERAGQRCPSFHIGGSPYCMGHSDEKAKIQAGRNRRIEKINEFREDLNGEIHATSSRKDVQKLTEKVINGILQGFIKKEKAGPLALFLPFAYKMAKEMELQGGNGAFRIDMQETTKTASIQMTEEQMDKYLAAPEHVRVEILEDMKRSGAVKMIKRDNTVKLETGEVAPEKIKIDTKAIAEISDKTDTPLTQNQVADIFGKNLRDTPDVTPGPDQSGFGDVFQPKAKGLPDGAIHKWKGAYERNNDTNPPTASLWFTCQQCGARAANVNKDLCPAGGKYQPPD